MMEENLSIQPVATSSNFSISGHHLQSKQQDKLLAEAIANSSWRDNSKQLLLQLANPQDLPPELTNPLAEFNNNNNNRVLDSSSTALHRQQQVSQLEGDGSDNYALSDFILQYVNLNLVRKMIAQNQIEFIFICVIITYLIYYFSLISRRPRLIGNDRSKFVQFIKTNLKSTLKRRFSPLIYFWGTNPQTALFGYLQGQTSLDEMPRNKFRRQYLYVSDAQYLTSNVDLSLHYGNTVNNKRRRHLLQLQVENVQTDSLDQQRQQQVTSGGGGLLDQNIRLALNQMLELKKASKRAGPISSGSASSSTSDDQLPGLKELELSSSSSGSSSDSGVFAGHSSSSSSSSTSSLADAVLAMDGGQQPDMKCSCKLRYLSEQPIIDEDASSQLLHTHLPASQGSQNEKFEFGQCALDWHKASHRHYHKNKLVALISAGMTTGSDKKYVTDTVMTLERLGYEVCVFIRRGVGGLKLSSTKFFSPAKWRDFEAAVMSVRQQRPGARLVAVGFSFGSIELCRYLSMSGKRSFVDAALLISCPFDPEAGGRNMRKRALNRRIDAYLARNLGKQLYQAMFGSGQPELKHSAVSNLNGSLVNLASLPKIKSLVDFEDNYNRVLQNYPNSEAYAADSRLQDHLSHINTPTLCLSSEDDFMAPLKLLPLEQIRSNKNLCMVLTKRGGHMAFIDGIFWPKKPYFAQRIIVKYMGAIKDLLLEPGKLAQIVDPPPNDEILLSTNPTQTTVNLSKANLLKINHQPSNKSHHLLGMSFDGK